MTYAAAPLTVVVLTWEAFKDWLSFSLHLPHLALHVMVGCLVPAAFLLVTRRPMTSLVPLVLLTILEAANEILDFLRYFLAGWPWQGRATLIEAVATLAPATLLVLAARWRRATSTL